MKLRGLIFLFLVTTAIQMVQSQQAYRLKKSTVTTIKVFERDSASLKVYVPKNFTTTIKWPLLFHVQIKQKENTDFTTFCKVAEATGCIAVSIDVADKRSLKASIDNTTKYLNFCLTTFPIDKRRMYSIGEGIDAEFTGMLPVWYKLFDGTIVINSTPNYGEISRFNHQFYYAGITNIRKYAYFDVMRTRKLLKQKGLPAEVYTVQNTTKIDKEIIRSLHAFKVRDMTRGKIEKDTIWMQRQYQEALEKVEQYLSNDEVVEAFYELRRIENTFRFTSFHKDVKNQLDTLQRSSRFKVKKNKHDYHLVQESTWRSNLALAFQEDVNNLAFYNLPWWNDQVKALYKVRKHKSNKQAYWTYRVEDYLKTIIANAQLQVKKTETQLFLAMLTYEIGVRSPETFFKIISYTALLGDYTTSLQFLEALLQTGYQNIESLYTIDHTLSLKITPEYNNMIKKYLGFSKYTAYQ
ncbi:hypothetical protein NBT05_00210 [Aquimarina sp. ERC-38]|uniref:hypothetical protein n=1 Tax=Aquimarina sp. ERC-38 TaxID=2949996 RepID=UPI002247AEA3|nr:hypothetical protein [Aquimarina sp. ERC-38]UZO80925.1 hypothetical protein NBT05_00210 [Aquimarina sp. ERC-38]